VKPKQVFNWTVYGRSYDVVSIIERLRRRNSSAVVALRLDVEGAEYSIIHALVDRPEILCFISFIFVEFHHSATPEQRAGLPHYGIASDSFEKLKDQVHAAMEQPQCRLRIYWRSFWASCGDQQRFEWRDSQQAVGS